MNDMLLSVPPIPRLHDWLGCWAIEQSACELLLSEIRGMDWISHLASYKPTMSTDIGVSMVPGVDGKSVAVIPMVGTLTKGRSSLGGTSTVMLRREIRQAANDPSVSGIMLSIDSPGGSVAGTEDLAAEVKAARKQKPVFAQINDLGASAAYWVAAQASKVFASNATTIVGSIGVMMSVRKNTSGEVSVITSGSLKAPGANGDLTEEERAHLQGIVNGWMGAFSSAVKGGRRMSDAQFEKVSSGAIFLASNAIDLKLIDGIQSQEASLKELVKAR